VRAVVGERRGDQGRARHGVAPDPEAADQVLERARRRRLREARANEARKGRERGVESAGGGPALERVGVVGRRGAGEKRSGVGLEAGVGLGELAEAWWRGLVVGRSVGMELREGGERREEKEASTKSERAK